MKVLLKNKATLFVVATPIGNLKELSPRAIDTLKNVSVIACEDTRNTLKILSHFDIHTKLISYHNFNEKESANGIIKLLNKGEDVALVSDAGYPLISDPGYILVNEVIKNDFNITCISGSNAALNALVVSGLYTNHYLFYGFLDSKITKAEKELEALKFFPYTLIFYEAPHRINRTINLCLKILGDRKAFIARELTKIHEEYYRNNLSELIKLDNLKGEIVLIIEGYNNIEDINYDELLKEMKNLINDGYRVKEAVLIISNKYNKSKNEIYNYYLKNREVL